MMLPDGKGPPSVILGQRALTGLAVSKRAANGGDSWGHVVEGAEFRGSL